MNTSSPRNLARRLVLIHAVLLFVLVLAATLSPDPRVTRASAKYYATILIGAFVLAQASLLGLWLTFGIAAWWRRLGSVMLAVALIGFLLTPINNTDAETHSLVIRFVSVFGGLATVCTIMFIAFMAAGHRRWRFLTISELVDTEPRLLRFSVFHLLAITTIVAILLAFINFVRSESGGDTSVLASTLLINGFLVFVLIVCMISAVRASLARNAHVLRMALVAGFALLLGIIPALAMEIPIEFMMVWPMMTLLPPLIVMVTLLPLRTKRIRLIVSRDSARGNSAPCGTGGDKSN